MRKILLTGGGTAGHVTPNLALVPYLEKEGFEITYMGSYDGIEKSLVEKEGIPYTGISSGKLRRYLDVKNFTDPARIIKGIREARIYMKKEQPDVLFSKGGFVSVPVVRAAAECHIPVVIHESDLSPGLANKLSIPQASKVCYSFPETAKYLTRVDAVHTGLPVRRELLSGSKEEGLHICGFDGSKPVLMIIGGSLGSAAVNTAVHAAEPELISQFDIIHICGNGKSDSSMDHIPGYRQFEYVNEELSHMFATADVVVSRAGANVINELAALRKPAVLIPLGLAASRGDQILNAESFRKRGFCDILNEEDMTAETLVRKIQDVYNNRNTYIAAMQSTGQRDSAALVTNVILSVLK